MVIINMAGTPTYPLGCQPSRPYLDYVFLRNASRWSSFLLLINDEEDSQRKEKKRCH